MQKYTDLLFIEGISLTMLATDLDVVINLVTTVMLLLVALKRFSNETDAKKQSEIIKELREKIKKDNEK